jgi:hypothetical protein
VARSLEERVFMINQFGSLLDHCASLLPFIAEDEDKHERYHVWIACTNSFTTDFRALYYFMFSPKRQATLTGRISSPEAGSRTQKVARRYG